MTQAPKDTRSPADKVRDTGGIVGSIEHEDYVSHPEKEAPRINASRGMT
jgi:hypothetical protein